MLRFTQVSPLRRSGSAISVSAYFAEGISRSKNIVIFLVSSGRSIKSIDLSSIADKDSLKATILRLSLVFSPQAAENKANLILELCSRVLSLCGPDKLIVGASINAIRMYAWVLCNNFISKLIFLSLRI